MAREWREVLYWLMLESQQRHASADSLSSPNKGHHQHRRGGRADDLRRSAPGSRACRVPELCYPA
jgi:hypothetical protein